MNKGGSIRILEWCKFKFRLSTSSGSGRKEADRSRPCTWIDQKYAADTHSHALAEARQFPISPASQYLSSATLRKCRGIPQSLATGYRTRPYNYSRLHLKLLISHACFLFPGYNYDCNCARESCLCNALRTAECFRKSLSLQYHRHRILPPRYPASCKPLRATWVAHH